MLYNVKLQYNTVCWLAHISSLAFCAIFMTMVECNEAGCPLIAFRLATPLLGNAVTYYYILKRYYNDDKECYLLISVNDDTLAVV